jgi:queuine tRNA-ribosyltransferase
VVAQAGVVTSYQLDASSGNARAGRILTRHGEVLTPAFMPVGTQATVKSLSSEEVAATGARMQIMNTYHLWLRPGPERVAELGGLHGFARWPHAIATDSGGFQAFSLAERMKMTEDGFEFASHLDGTRLKLTPEEAMRIQGLLGSDIAMQLDVCLSGTAALPELMAAVDRTTRWAERCLAAQSPGQALFGIVQARPWASCLFKGWRWVASVWVSRRHPCTRRWYRSRTGWTARDRAT